MTTTETNPACLDATDALRWLCSRVRLRPGRTLVGIDGPEGSGKDGFAEELASLLADGGQQTLIISLQDYGLDGNLGDCNAAEVRTFIEDVIEPLRNEGSGRYRTPETDDHGHPRWKCADEQAVILVEGLGLHQAPCCTEAHKLWDLSIWLDTPDEAPPQPSRSEPSDPHDDPSGPPTEPVSQPDLVVDNTQPHEAID